MIRASVSKSLVQSCFSSPGVGCCTRFTPGFTSWFVGYCFACRGYKLCLVSGTQSPPCIRVKVIEVNIDRVYECFCFEDRDGSNLETPAIMRRQSFARQLVCSLMILTFWPYGRTIDPDRADYGGVYLPCLGKRGTPKNACNKNSTFAHYAGINTGLISLDCTICGKINMGCIRLNVKCVNCSEAHRATNKSCPAHKASQPQSTRNYFTGSRIGLMQDLFNDSSTGDMKTV